MKYFTYSFLYFFVFLVGFLCVFPRTFSQDMVDDSSIKTRPPLVVSESTDMSNDVEEETNEDQGSATRDDGIDWFVGKAIGGFDFRGLSHVKRADLFNVLSQYKNKDFTYELLYEMQNLLYSLEFFAEVTPEAQRTPRGALVLIFTVVEYPTISKMTFLGNLRLSKGVLLNAMTLKSGDLLSKSRVDAAVQELKQKYFTEGYSKAAVNAKVVDDPRHENRMYVEFYISEGVRTAISEVLFTGNTIFSSKKLAKKLVSKKKSIFNKGIYSTTATENDKNIIKQKYMQRGYLDATVLDVLVDKKEQEGIQNVTLTFVISEGVQYMFGDIVFSGNTVFENKQLRSLFSLKEGDVADGTKFQRGFDSIRLLYANKGFLFNVYDYEEMREEETSKIVYAVSITEYGQAHISNIIVQGNIKTKEYVITRELGFINGSVMSVNKLQVARNRLVSLGYFKSVEPEIKAGESEGLIDVLVNVEESTFRDIRFGATFGGSTEFPLSLFLSWNQKNLLGRGFGLSAKIIASPVEQSINISFIDPYVGNSPFSLSASVGFSHENVKNVSQDIEAPFMENDKDRTTRDSVTGVYVFTQDTEYEGHEYMAGTPFPRKSNSLSVPKADEISKYKLKKDYQYFRNHRTRTKNALMSYNNFSIFFNLGTGYTYYSPFGKLGATVSLGPTFNFVLYNDDIYRPASFQLRRNLKNWKIYNAFSMKGFYDSRNISFEPTSGILISQRLTFYGGILLGDSHYIKSNTVLEGHLPLVNMKVSENWSLKFVLAANSTFDAIFPQMFYPPGKSFERDGPQYNQRLRLNGIYNARGWSVYNGEATWNSWVELRMALVERVFWFDGFFEVAGLWEKLEQVNTIDPEKYYFTFGAGFRFVIPQFPIRLYLAKRFKLDEKSTVMWQRGNLTASKNPHDASGIDLIFSIGLNF